MLLFWQKEMGTYLSSPKTDKLSEEGENDELKYGLSSMQGWRATMEDAVSQNIVLLFLVDHMKLLKVEILDLLN